MLYREDLEKREYDILSERAVKAAESRGRAVYEEPCRYRTDFQRDRDRIIHSKSFRRLMHKTQVFLAPEGDHYRTRLTHTLEVTQVARTIARTLGLNEDLTEAIALGHDLGHTPFGHSGEYILDRIHPGGFRHNEQSLRVADYLESTPSRTGMNLTFEVRDGILNHSGKLPAATLEGQIVKDKRQDCVHKPRHRRRPQKRCHNTGGSSQRASRNFRNRPQGENRFHGYERRNLQRLSR